MTVMTEASNALFNRSPEEHFASFGELWRDAANQHINARLIDVGLEHLFLTSDGEDAKLRVGDRINEDYALSQLGMEQFLREIGVPVRLAERFWYQGEEWRKSFLTFADRARMLTETSERQLLVDKATNTVRAITSASYERLWDNELCDHIDRWLIGTGFTPTLPTINTSGGQNIRGTKKPALFRGDRSSLIFLSYGGGSGTDGQITPDEFGGLTKGALFINSEVGYRAYEQHTFLFRGMCANFLIWDVSKRSVLRRAHNRGFRDWFGREALPRLIEVSREIEPATWTQIQCAAEAAFVGDGSPTRENRVEARKRLTEEFKLTQSLAAAVIEAAELPQNAPLGSKQPVLSHWTISNGLTWEAKNQRFAESIVDLGETAERIVRKAKRPRLVTSI